MVEKKKLPLSPVGADQQAELDDEEYETDEQFQERLAREELEDAAIDARMEMESGDRDPDVTTWDELNQRRQELDSWSSGEVIDHSDEQVGLDDDDEYETDEQFQERLAREELEDAAIDARMEMESGDRDPDVTTWDQLKQRRQEQDQATHSGFSDRRKQLLRQLKADRDRELRPETDVDLSLGD